MSASEVVRSGECFCGKSRVFVSGEPVAVSICHCSICRKLSGAPFSAQALCKAEQVRVETADEPTSVESSPNVRRHRCASCGSPIYASMTVKGRRQGEMRAVPLSLINAPGSPNNLKPTHHMYYGHRVIDVTDDLPKFVKSNGELWTPEADAGDRVI